MAILNIRFEPLGVYLSNGVYVVPGYQRPYAWSTSEVNDYWMDLINLFENESSNDHFLGQAVIHEDDGFKYIVDGQQRTITSILLLSCFRSIFYEYVDYKEDAIFYIEDISNQYIGSSFDSDLLDSDLNFIYSLNSNKNRIFKNYIQDVSHNVFDLKLSDLSFDSDKNVVRNYKDLFKKLKSYINNTLDPYNTLVDLYELFLNKFYILVLSTDSFEEAYVIFETLNNRGLDLSLSDLTKSHFLRLSCECYDEINAKWSKLESIVGQSKMSKFIEAYLKSQFGSASSRDFFKLIKSISLSEKDVLSILDDLLEISYLYVFLDNPKSFMQNPEFLEFLDLDSSSINILSLLSLLGGKAHISLVLSAYYYLSNTDYFNNLILSYFIFYVRNIVFYDQRANLLSPIINKFCVESTDFNSCKNSSLLLLERLESYLVSDLELEVKLSEFDKFSKNNILAFLVCIYAYQDSSFFSSYNPFNYELVLLDLKYSKLMNYGLGIFYLTDSNHNKDLLNSNNDMDLSSIKRLNEDRLFLLLNIFSVDLFKEAFDGFK